MKKVNPELRPGALWLTGCIVVGLLAAFVVHHDATSHGRETRVWEATTPIAANAQIGPSQVRSVPVLAAETPPDALTSSPVGQYAAASVYPGQVLVREDTSGANSLPTLAGQYGATDVAVSIPLQSGDLSVNDVQAGEGVDVIGILANGAKSTMTYAAMDAPVLYVDKQTSAILIAVTKREALVIAGFVSGGHFEVVLDPQTPQEANPRG